MLPTKTWNKGLFWNLDDIFDVFSYKDSMGSVNISEDESKYLLEFNVAGMNKENIEVSIEDGVLNVEGHLEEKEEKETKNYHRREFQSASFKRSFQLPEGVTDAIEAKVKKGILVVELPKVALPEREKSKRIEIK